MKLEYLKMAFYIVSLSLQLASAGLLISLRPKRSSIIKQFVNKNLSLIDDDKKEVIYNHEQFKNEFEQIYLTRTSFFCLGIGIILQILGEESNFPKLMEIGLVFSCSIIICLYSSSLIRKTVGNIKKIQYDEISDEIINFGPQSEKDIDEIIERTEVMEQENLVNNSKDPFED